MCGNTPRIPMNFLLGNYELRLLIPPISDELHCFDHPNLRRFSSTEHRGVRGPRGHGAVMRRIVPALRRPVPRPARGAKLWHAGLGKKNQGISDNLRIPTSGPRAVSCSFFVRGPLTRHRENICCWWARDTPKSY